MTKPKPQMVKAQARKTIHFVSLGCPKNRVDTEVMAGLAVAAGYQIVSDPSDATIIVVDTCGFIESAKQESIEVLLDMARFRAQGKCRTLVAAGCLAQRYAQDLAQEVPELDHLVGTSHPDHLTEILEGVAARLDVGPAGHFLPTASTPRFLEPGAATAYVKIGDGCSRLCSFCAIPAIRGTARSRQVSDVVEEVKLLVARGIVEVCLVAQDTAAFGRDRGGENELVRLVEQLDDVPGLRWARLLYLYPDSVPDALLDAMGQLRTLAPYLDIPIQHASDAMLRCMRRGHGAKSLRRLIEHIRNRAQGAFLRTSVLVGHPGESEDDFAQLLAFLEWAEFDHVGAFRYSAEEGTQAASAQPKVSARLSYARYRKVMALSRRLAKAKAAQLRGRQLEVLVEGSADDQGFVRVGRHIGQAPEIDGQTYLVSSNASPGDIVLAKIIEGRDHDLVAEPVVEGA
ncbi:MAG: 30S ribosomal protein S12 methylthiotransferase RimO [Myxococcota bacterium]|nr:30S ribosomal protein S12 methylthiotransferase RimO [Myxococcota bacterium]